MEYMEDKKTANDVWDAFQNAFEIPCKLITKKKFQELKLPEGGDVKQFLLRLEREESARTQDD